MPKIELLLLLNVPTFVLITVWSWFNRDIVKIGFRYSRCDRFRANSCYISFYNLPLPHLSLVPELGFLPGAGGHVGILVLDTLNDLVHVQRPLAAVT